MAAKTSKECCLCGDIGFAKDLVLCPICSFRLQHTYCSSSYPGIDMATWRCEWCVYEQEKRVRPGPPEADEATRFRRRRDDDRRASSVSDGSPRKRQRTGAERWRKRGCDSPSSRAIGRRYKLLADVLC